MLPPAAVAQPSFEAMVDLTFGIDQGLVNGIQFSNQYIRIEGNPYFMDGGYRLGAVCIRDQWYESVPLRYNLYTQKVEIEYLSREGDMNQLITVPEQMSAFLLEDFKFKRMQLGKDDWGYYMDLSSERTACYVRWSLDAIGESPSQRRFSPLKRNYWIRQGEQWTSFHDRKTYVRAFPPERKKEFRRLLKSKKFYFQLASAGEVANLIGATLRLYEEEEGP
jgi:hypothetical protein